MSTDYRRVSEFLRQIVGNRDQADAQRLRPHFEPAPPAVPGGSGVELDVIDERWSLLPNPPESRARVADPASLDDRESYCRNIENFIGTVKVPVGVVGPLRVNGLFAHGDFYVPLATTEAALVASHSRGARLITEAGGCTAALLNEGVTRAPGFAFATLTEARPVRHLGGGLAREVPRGRGGDDEPRQADRHARDRRGQSRLSRASSSRPATPPARTW